MCRAAAVLSTPVASRSGAARRRHGVHQTAVRSSVSTGRVTLRSSSRRVNSVVRAKEDEDVDWDAKTKEMTAERIMEKCMEAMADGDEELLQSCLLELEEPEEKNSVIANLIEEKSDDEFWRKKLAEIAAERVLENCMSAVVRRVHVHVQVHVHSSLPPTPPSPVASSPGGYR